MLKLFDPILTDLSAEPLSLAPRRYGLVAACDGGLLEVSGLAVPVGSLCSVAHGRAMTLSAEVIGFRNGRTLMMLLGDSVMLRPGARVCPVGRPGLMAVGAAFLGRAIEHRGDFRILEQAGVHRRRDLQAMLLDDGSGGFDDGHGLGGSDAHSRLH